MWAKATPGAPLRIPVADYNGAMDAAKWYADNKHKFGVSPPIKGSSGQVTVTITGFTSPVALGGGKYYGKIQTGNCTITAAGNLSMPAGRTVPAADDCIVCNINETSTHDLTLNRTIIGTIVPGTLNGLKIVWTDTLQTAC
jgi:hypothetical protein